MDKFKIYGAGQMSGLTYEAMNSWRVEAINLLKKKTDKVSFLNPCDYYNFSTFEEMKASEKEVKVFDLNQVRHSNLVLVKLSNSIGTAQELQVAEDNNIPIVGFGYSEGIHPWILLNLSKKCETLEEAINYICEFYISAFN